MSVGYLEIEAESKSSEVSFKTAYYFFFSKFDPFTLSKAFPEIISSYVIKNALYEAQTRKRQNLKKKHLCF